MLPSIVTALVLLKVEKDDIFLFTDQPRFISFHEVMVVQIVQKGDIANTDSKYSLREMQQFFHHYPLLSQIYKPTQYLIQHICKPYQKRF